MTKETQRPWFEAKREPTACFAHTTGIFRSDRTTAGPLRMGTAPGTGPHGAGTTGSSDFELDRISPKSFDPLGTTLDRFGSIQSARISKEVRSGAVRRSGDKSK